MATTTSEKGKNWDTFHNNGPFPTEVIYTTTLTPKDRSLDPRVDKIRRYNDASTEIRRLIQECLSAGANSRFRGFGSGWSLSKIALSERMHFNAAMNISLPVVASEMHSASGFQSENLFFFQCGNTIKEVSRKLKRKGKALKMSGASNGQTIAGAVTTGVHGAALDAGAIQDCVVGIHLIIGPNPDDVVYIEPNSAPAMSDAFAASLESRIIRNDGLFYAALIGLGSFGFIAGLVIEAENLYLLKRYTKYIKRADALQLGLSLDFKNSNFKIDSELNPDGTGKRPYHYKLYVNPYNPNEDFLTEIIYKKPYREDYPSPIPLVEKFIYTDLPGWIANFAAKHKRVVPTLMNAMKGTIFPTVDKTTEGTIGEIFWDSTHKGAGFAWALGVDHSNAQKALDLFVKVANEKGPVPGAIGVRFVKASQATLAFTRFPVTCIVEMDGIQWEPNNNMISMKEFERFLIQAYTDANIPFTWHWGKNATWDFPDFVQYMYGDKKQTWLDYRSALLRPETARLFSNGFLDSAGLSDYNALASNDLVQSVVA